MKKVFSFLLAFLLVFNFCAPVSAKEGDGTFTTANLLVANQEYVGNLINEEDADMFKFVFPEDGVLQLKFVSVRQSTPVNANIYDLHGNLLETINNINNNVPAKDLSYRQNTILYIRIDQSSKSSNDYKIVPIFSPIRTYRLLNYELESNDTVDESNVMSNDQTYNGMIYNESDIDNYIFEADKVGTLNFDIKVYGNTKANVMAIIKSDTAKILDVNENITNINTSSYEVIAGDKVLVQIKSPNAYGVYYSITPHLESLKVKTAKINKVTRNDAKKMTVTLKKDSSINGRQIQYSTSKKFTKKTTKTVNTTKNKKVIKLPKNKTYYVRVRNYQKVRGQKVYSVWSAVKKVNKVKTNK